jgi:hypothetical protein
VAVADVSLQGDGPIRAAHSCNRGTSIVAPAIGDQPVRRKAFKMSIDRAANGRNRRILPLAAGPANVPSRNR